MKEIESKELLFTLFRVQVFLPEQLPLFVDYREPSEFLKAALLEKPTVENARGSWHIGNVKDVLPNGLYFAIGKELPRRVGSLDDEGDFQNYATLVAPNTHALLDLHYQVLAIAKNSELAPQSKTVSRKLQKLLQATSVISGSKAKVEISAIDDPVEFIQIITRAAAVTKFQVTYGLPNVWDAEEDFQKPFQKASRTLGAEEATAVFRSEDLDRQNVIKLTRAAAAVGKRAKAWIRRHPRSRPIPMTPKNKPATHASEAPPAGTSQLLRWANETILEIRKLYEEIRSSDE